MMTLDKIKEGRSAVVRRIEAGKNLNARLHNMGIIPGERVRVIRSAHGEIIIARDNARFALGRGMAHKILVEETE